MFARQRSRKGTAFRQWEEHVGKFGVREGPALPGMKTSACREGPSETVGGEGLVQGSTGPAE